ncbi:endo-1,4-beta-xylanase 5-like [Aristolochia californica]|uniref:endo-1,4-beta-xylanase 5-like n=1 Tax=Aristolochia californica TaxID=171875 RepID=UPI0035D826A5
MAIVWEDHRVLLIFFSVLFAGIRVNSLPYDYSASIECLAEPLKPQYGGGILVNPEFQHGLRGWAGFGGVIASSNGGNSFMVVRSGGRPTKRLYLHDDRIYTFSAWVQISEGSARVGAVFNTADGDMHAGATIAEAGCWSMIKGGLSVNKSGPAELYFQSKNASVEIWIDSISLQPFTREEWRSHQEESTQKARKRSVRFQAVDSQGKSLPGANLSIELNRASFPLGCAINRNILQNTGYQQWFTARKFTVTVFEDELKWYSTERNQGQEDYSVSDALFAFAKRHGLAVRGHNVFWDDAKYQMGWINNLSPDQLRAATDKRINSVMSRYAGQVNSWDVVNENLHFNFYESKLGAGFSTDAYQKAHRLDGRTTMFLNEYNTLEYSGDRAVTPSEYIKKVNQIKSQGPTGIGLEGHFVSVNLAYIRSAIDQLAATGLPIWITELDVANSINQAQALEQILREASTHPAVHGVVIWAAWSPGGCYKMCLTDNNFRNLPTGDVVDKLLREWGALRLQGTTDSDGYFEAVLPHGDYQVTIFDPSKNSSFAHAMKVEADTKEEKSVLHLEVHASEA